MRCDLISSIIVLKLLLISFIIFFLSIVPWAIRGCCFSKGIDMLKYSLVLLRPWLSAFDGFRDRYVQKQSSFCSTFDFCHCQEPLPLWILIYLSSCFSIQRLKFLLPSTLLSRHVDGMIFIRNLQMSEKRPTPLNWRDTFSYHSHD